MMNGLYFVLLVFYFTECTYASVSADALNDDSDEVPANSSEDNDNNRPAQDEDQNLEEDYSFNRYEAGEHYHHDSDFDRRPLSLINEQDLIDEGYDFRGEQKNLDLETDVKKTSTSDADLSSEDDVSNDKEHANSRPIKVGDYMTAAKLLPLAEIFIQKIDNPGAGKGIVSSSKRPEELADKLFEDFFVTKKRIVKIREQDILGLDALQALSLDGQVNHVEDKGRNPWIEPLSPLNNSSVDNPAGYHGTPPRDPLRCSFRVITMPINKTLQRKGYIEHKASHVTSKKGDKQRLTSEKGSKQRLTFKKGNKRRLTPKKGGKQRLRVESKADLARRGQGDKQNRGVLRAGQKLTKKLGKNRQLVVNAARRVKKGHHATKKVPQKKKTKLRRVRKPHKKEEIMRSGCYWKYTCLGMALRTCGIILICPDNRRSGKTGYTFEEINKRKMRRMLGITYLDEEVQKIIQKHLIESNMISTVNPEEKLETLEEYFHRIVLMEMDRPDPINISEYVESAEDPPIWRRFGKEDDHTTIPTPKMFDASSTVKPVEKA